MIACTTSSRKLHTVKVILNENLEDYHFKISPKSFFQTNSLQGEVLYAITRQFAELNGTQTVYDLYCGTGSIGIFVSALAKKIIGVEMVRRSYTGCAGECRTQQYQSCTVFHRRCSNNMQR